MDPSLIKDLGLPTFYALLTLYFKQKQDEQHREDLKAHKIELVALARHHMDEMAKRDAEYFHRLDEIRVGYEDRQQRAHDRANQLTIEVLQVIRQNSVALTTLVTMMKEEE